MAWLRVESRFPDHPKVYKAGDRLPGHHGSGRVLAVWLFCSTYAVEHLTDGFIATEILEKCRHDREPLLVAEAMRLAGLLHKVKGGYQLHDYHDYNPSGADVKEKRAKERDKKRKQREDEAAASLGEHNGHVPQLSLGDMLAVPEGHKEGLARARSDTDSDTEYTQDQEQRRSRAATPSPVEISSSAPAENDNPRVLAKLAHVVLDDVDAAQLEKLDALEELQCRAARMGLRYDGDRANKAMNSAEYQRLRRRAS